MCICPSRWPRHRQREWEKKISEFAMDCYGPHGFVFLPTHSVPCLFRLVAMDIISTLCIVTIISNVYFPSLCFIYSYNNPKCFIYSYNNPKCALPFSVCLAAIQNNQACVYAYNNPKCVLLPSLCSIYSYHNPKCTLPLSVCLAAIQNNQACVYAYNNNPKCVLPLSVCVAAIQSNQACVYAYNNPKYVLFPSLCRAAAEPYSLVPKYEVFLINRGIDVKESVASLIFHNLENKGFKVFLDKNSIQGGDNIPQSIEEAIHSASVHVVIFSANYAESTWCLKELKLILKTGAPIIPVFCGVRPSELRMKDKDSVYARAFQMHKHTGNFEPHTLEEWKKALHDVSYIKGYIFTGDQGELLEQIAMNVAELINRAKFQLLN